MKSTGTSHLVIGKGQVKLTSETAIKAKDQESKNTSIIEKQMSDLQVNNQVEVKNFINLQCFHCLWAFSTCQPYMLNSKYVISQKTNSKDKI